MDQISTTTFKRIKSFLRKRIPQKNSSQKGKRSGKFLRPPTFLSFSFMALLIIFNGLTSQKEMSFSDKDIPLMYDFAMTPPLEIAPSPTIFMLPADLPWAGSTLNGQTVILQPGIAFVSCGTTSGVAVASRYTIALMDISGAVPGAGRSEVTGTTDVWHHPDWTIDKIGNIYGIAINKKTGDMFAAASANYGAGYFGQSAVVGYGSIGGGINDLSAAGTVYKIDAETGVPTVFTVLPQQSSTFTMEDCESSDTATRTTGVGLGNIAYDEDNDQYFVTNMEDGRIYRIDLTGTILDSYDPLTYDDGVAGITDVEGLAYGVVKEPGTDRLFFGSIDSAPGANAQAGSPAIYSIDLTPSGGFAGTVDNTFLHAGATYDNYVGTETLHTTISTGSGASFSSNYMYFISSLDFSFDGELLVGVRVGCKGTYFSSYNHWGEIDIVTKDANTGIYNINITEFDISFFGDAGPDDSYGGVGYYLLNDGSGDVQYAISSGDILNEQGPHGIAVFKAESIGSPVSPLGAISYGTVDNLGNGDPKGVGGDVLVFSGCVIDFITLTPSDCSTGTYTLNGEVVFTSPPNPLGLITVTVDNNGTPVSVQIDPSVSTTFSIPGLSCDSDMGVQVSATFDNQGTCTITDSFDEPAPPPCDVALSNLSAGACVNGVFTLDGVITTTNPTNADILLTITQGITTINQTLASTATSFQVTGLACDGQTVTVNAQVDGIAGCTDVATLVAPNCSIAVSVDNVTTCSAGTYDISGTLSYTNPPTGDITVSLTENGVTTTTTITPPQTAFSFTGLTCDGENGLTVTATFDDLQACNNTDTYDEPCYVEITDVAIADNCLASSTYNLTFTYTVYNAPGNLDFTGTFPGSPLTVAMSAGDDAVGTTVSINNIPCGMVVSTETVTASFAADMGCNDMDTYAPPLDGVQLGDTLWVDTNGNGLQDPMEPPVEGVTVELFTCNMGVIGATTGLTLTTDANGYYKFDGIPAGEYAVKFDISTGTLASMANYKYTPANIGGDDTNDSDAVPSMGQMAMSGCVELAPGDDYEDLDAGVYLPGKIGDIVWEDINGNGVQDAGEPPVQDATATLGGTDGLGNPVTPVTLTTGVDGMYMFGNLPPGDYKVTFATPAGTTFEFTAVDDPSSNGNDINDSDADPAMGGMTPLYTVTSGDTIPTVDAGMYIPGKLGDLVWEDTNGNGVQDAGEPPVLGAAATLGGTDGLGNPVTPVTLTTGIDGMYMFGNLPPGDYKVTFATPVGTTFEFIAVDDPSSNGDDTNDSDADPAMGGMTPLYTVESGDTIPTVDAGMYVPGKLGDLVWEDYNNNGEQDAGEPPIQSVTIELDGTDGLGNPIPTQTLTTDMNGMYMFGDLWPGDYKITFTTPADYNPTKVDEAGVADNVDSDADPAMSGMTGMYPIMSGDTISTVDAGYFGTDYGDLPDSYGTTDGAIGPKHITIPQLILGECVDAELDGQNQNMAGLMMGGDDGNTSSLIKGSNCADDENGISFITPVVPGFEACIEIDVVNTTGNPAVLQGWLDFDGDGVMSAGEELTTVDFAGGGASIPSGGVTDLEVCFDIPATAAYVQGDGFMRFRLSSNGGLNATGINSDGSIPQGEVEDYKLPDAKVGNLIWEDRNYNGIQDAGTDVGLNGLEVELMWAGVDGIMGTADDQTYTTVSSTMGGKDGLYMFGGLTPGDYKLTVITDRFATLKGIGTDENVDSDDEDGELFKIVDVTDQPLGENGINDMPGMTNADNPANSYPDNQDNLTFDFGYAGFDYGDLPTSFFTVEADSVGMPGMHPPKHLFTPTWYMGICVDIDLDGQPSADGYAGYYPGSTGDDNTAGLASFPSMVACADDENGVVLKTSMVPGYEACYDVMTTGPVTGFMQAWIDYNGNNTFDAGEEITWTRVNGATVSTTDASIAAGTDVVTELCYMIPSTATFPALETYLRFRYSNLGGLNYKNPYAGGAFPFGEVEDYYQPLAELGDYVWHDTDGDGVQDAGELPVEGVVVNLHDCTNPMNPVLIATTTTDVNGFYEFIGLIPMEKYCVEFDLDPINAGIPIDEDKYIFTFKDSPNADATDDNDSDVDHLGMTEPVMMMDRERNESLDAGIYIPVSLGDYVWIDTNQNGLQDVGEVPVEGARLFLSGTNNIGQPAPGPNMVPAGQPIPVTMLLTDVNGFYHFGNLAPGTYNVTFDVSMITGPPELARFAQLLVYTVNDLDPTDVEDNDVDPGDFDSPIGMTPFYDLISGAHLALLDAGVAIPCLPPTDIWVDMTMITTANLHWTVNNSPLDPSGIDTYAHCWNIAIGATGFEPWENEAVQLIMVCYDDPNITIIGDLVSYDLTGLQPGTCYDIYIQEGCNGLIPPNSTYGWVNAPGTPQIGDLLGNPLLSTDVNPDGLCTFDDPEIVAILTTSPSCPYISPGYAPNGSFTVQVEDGASCGNTLYDIVITPVVNSTPGNSTPIATTPTQYLGVVAGTYSFANVDAGSYTVVVTEQGPCNPKNDPQTHLVVIADGVDDEDPDKVVTDILGNEVATDMGTIIIPEGACHYQLQLFLQADDACDGPIIADGAVWTTVVMTPSTISPGTQSSVTSNGNGFYRIDVDFATGTTELTVHVTDVSGNITEMTYTVTVEDNTAPDVSIVGANNTTIPHCADEMDITVTVYIDDACDQDIDPANVNFNANGTEVLNFDGGDYFEYIVTVTTQDNGAIWSASYTDADGNTGFADIAITVEQAVADADPVIIAADENISQLNCDDDEVCYSFQVWDDCEAIDIAAVTFDAGGANMTLTYIDDQSQTNVAFFEACGIVSEGTYVMTIQYGGQSVQPILNVNAEENQAPVITMPGNLNFTLPVCEGELQTTLAVQVTDECDNPINPGNVTVTLGGITLDVNDAYITGGYYEWVITLDASNDGDLLIASYTDADGATTTVDALITVTTQPDNWGPIVIYPSQNINVEIDECDDAVEIVCFEVTATDNCDGDLTPSVTLNGASAGIILPSPGGDTYCVAVAPGEHHVVISVTDAAGNTTEEDFFIVVTQDEAPDVNLACLGTFNITLGDNCEAELIAANVLTGEWACLTEDDFIVTVIDDNPYNGGIIDGCGTYQYTVSLNQEAIVNGFTGPFASANWSVVQAAPASSVSIGGSTMVLSSTSANVDAMTAIAMPSDGTLSFDYDFIADVEFGIGWDYFIIDINGGVVATGNFDEIGSINETVSAGNILVMTIEDDGFDAGTATLLTITNFVFEASSAVDAGDFTTCWGEVTAEDKTAPTIDCADDTDTAIVNGQSHDLVCTDIDNILIDGIQTYATYADGTTIPGSISQTLDAILSATGYPSIADNCGDVWVEVSDQVVEHGDCGTVVITRTFNIHDRYNKCEDSAGQPMTASCTQIITLRKPTLAEVTLPAQTTSNECDEGVALDENGHPHPSVTGYPTIQTAFANHTINQTYCNLAANYSDTDLINICDGMYKFIRTWTLIDWCEPGQTFTYTQLIEVGDYTAPQIICGGSDADWDGVPDGPYQYSTGPFDCNASFEVPFPYSVTDNCSDYDLSTEIISIVEITLYNQWGQVIGTTMGEQLIASLAPGQYVSGVPMGEGILRYTATDDCGNASTVDCPFVVIDQINPVAVCDDDLHISIGGAGYARVYASDVDEGSHDNCTDIRMEVRRAGGVWGEYVDFDCSDVHNYVTIELRVWDDANGNGIYGNWYGNENHANLPDPDDAADNGNLCWLEVLVEDKINPTCTAPHNETRHCDDDELLHIDWDNADQLNEVFGAATAEDNCNAIAEQVSVNNNLNDCGWGTVVRTFRAVDDWGLTSLNACQQVITVYEVHNYELKFPKDAEANCGTPNPDTIEYNTLACDLITVNVNDERFEASSDECYKVLRTYKVINWCEWDGESAPIVLGRDEDCDNNPGDEDVWVIVRTEWNGSDPIYTSYLDRDNSETNNNPFLGNNRCGTGTGQLPNGHWSNSNNNPELQSVGHWQYTQVIKVYDNEAPTAEAVDYDVFCGEYADCTGDVEITFTITEYCDLDVVTLEGFIDLYADGTQDGAATLTEDEAAATATTRTFTISGNYAIGAHAFGVHIEDGCHNITWLELPFEIADCKAPTPVCINGLTVTLMPQPDGCCAMAIWASDFIGSPITDCTEPIKYSIHRGAGVDAGTEIPSSDQTGLVLDCNDEATVVIYIYAWDSANNPYSVQPDGTVGGPNYDFCDTYVLVQEHISCPDTSDPARVAGTIMTELNEGVQAVEMQLSGNMFQDALTENDGGYEFEEQAETGYDYTVTPHLDVEAPNSVSTFDLVLITKHILGIQYLDSPYKIIAADINSSQTVTTADMIQLRKHILGIYEEYPNNTFWRFVDADYIFPDPTNPWLESFPEVRNIAGLAQDELQENFIGVAIGDVNGSALPNFTSVEERNVNGLFAITTKDTKVKAGADYRVSFTAADLEKVQGYQFTLTFDKTALSLTDIEYGVAKAENFGMNYLAEGMITTSWNEKISDETAKDAVLFTLVFHANTSATLSDLIGISSRITRAEAYDNNGTMDVAINFTNGVVVTAGFKVYQNTPNPFNGDTKIGFSLPQDAVVKIAIQDVTGKTLKLIRKDGKKGYNAITINAKTLGAAGVLYYTVSTENNTATKKMIVVE